MPQTKTDPIESDRDKIQIQIQTHIIVSQISWTDTHSRQKQTTYSQIGARNRDTHIS